MQIRKVPMKKIVFYFILCLNFATANCMENLNFIINEAQAVIKNSLEIPELGAARRKITNMLALSEALDEKEGLKIYWSKGQGRSSKIPSKNTIALAELQSDIDDRINALKTDKKLMQTYKNHDALNAKLEWAKKIAHQGSENMIDLSNARYLLENILELSLANDAKESIKNDEGRRVRSKKSRELYNSINKLTLDIENLKKKRELCEQREKNQRK